jgi:hypothetical protein
MEDFSEALEVTNSENIYALSMPSAPIIRLSVSESVSESKRQKDNPDSDTDPDPREIESNTIFMHHRMCQSQVGDCNAEA